MCTDYLLIRPDEVERFDRGGGVATIPYVGKWNSDQAALTTGQTVFQPGTGAGEFFDLEVGQATWVPAGVPHRFLNRGPGVMRIYWVYGGRDVTRTITATGETFEHLSAHDRGGAPTT